MPEKPERFNWRSYTSDLIYFLAAIFVVLFIRNLWVGEWRVKTVPYSEFHNLLDKGQIKEVLVGPGQITGTFTSPETGSAPQTFLTVRVDPEIASDFVKHSIPFSGEPGPGFLDNLLSWLLPIAGQADDLSRATEIARNMVVRFGMTPALGQVSYEPESTTFLAGSAPIYRPRTYANDTAAVIDHTIKDPIDTAFIRSRAILAANKAELLTSAKSLRERETLGVDDLARIKKELKGPEEESSLVDASAAAAADGV